jgi:hypothetical protein
MPSDVSFLICQDFKKMRKVWYNIPCKEEKGLIFSSSAIINNSATIANRLYIKVFLRIDGRMAVNIQNKFFTYFPLMRKSLSSAVLRINTISVKASRSIMACHLHNTGKETNHKKRIFQKRKISLPDCQV